MVYRPEGVVPPNNVAAELVALGAETALTLEGGVARLRRRLAPSPSAALRKPVVAAIKPRPRRSSASAANRAKPETTKGRCGP